MNPLIRSLEELMLITNFPNKQNISYNDDKSCSSVEDSGQRKRYIRSKDKKGIKLPYLPRNNTQKWIKGKEAIYKFFDKFDYNNQIQSTYDLTLLERQKYYDKKDVA